MDDIDRRLAALKAKCSHEAWVLLQIGRKHEDFRELLSRLEQFSGKVLETDVEQIFRVVARKLC